jgi:hypothetical protein
MKQGCGCDRKTAIHEERGKLPPRSFVLGHTISNSRYDPFVSDEKDRDSHQSPIPNVDLR